MADIKTLMIALEEHLTAEKLPYLVELVPKVKVN